LLGDVHHRPNEALSLGNSNCGALSDCLAFDLQELLGVGEMGFFFTSLGP
jgi:hypothetical protein